MSCDITVTINPPPVDTETCLCGNPVLVRTCERAGGDFMKLYTSCAKDIGDPSRCAYFRIVSETLEEKDDPSCLCNLRCQSFQIHKAGPNFGRWFYACGLPIGHPDRCDFWQLVGGPAYVPLKLAGGGVLCSCGKGAVTGEKTTPGPNCGRRFVKCAKKKCGFFRWI